MSQHRLAIIGNRGHIGIVTRELPQLPDVELVAVAESGDSIDPLLKWCADNGRSPKRYADYRAMLDESKPDAVVVCGAFEQHAEMCVDALDRGIHVFTEKPAALSFDELDELRAAVERNGRVHLAGMMQSRYDAGFYTAHNLIRGGAIGDVRLINARKSYRLGKRAPYYHRRPTYGGTIPWVGSHAIDWMLWFAGSEGRATSVFATQSALHNGGNGTMERSAACLFTLAGERAATVSIDVFRPENAPTHGDDWARLVGSTGVIEVRPGSVNLINPENDGTRPVAVACDRRIFADFFDHIAGRREALVGASDTLELTELCLMARQSADEGVVVRR